MPDPIPVILLGRLAVDEDYRGRHLGSAPLINAVGRSLAVSNLIGARAAAVQAIDEQAKSSYGQFGFRPFSDREPLVLILRISEIEALLRQ